MTLKNINNYDITIYNSQRMDDDTDVIEEKSIGTFSIRDNKAYIMYKSGEGGDETTSVVTASEDGVKIKRKGAVNSDMLYVEGRRTSFIYRIPYGTMDMEIYTELIENSLNDDGGELHLVYDLSVQGAVIKNDMKIKVSRGKE